MTPTKINRRSTRSRQSVSYKESPVDKTASVRKSAKKSVPIKSKNVENSDEEDSPEKHLSSARKSLVFKRNTKGIKADNISNTTVKKSSRKKSPVIDTNSDDDAEIAANTPKQGSKSSRKAEKELSELSPRKLRRNRATSEKGLEAIVIENSPTIAKIDTPVVRRSARKQNQSYSDNNLGINLRKEKEAKLIISSDEERFEDFDDSTVQKVDKPTTLFNEDEDVEGGALYPIKTPKKKDSMALLAQQHTPKTPRHNVTPKTPRNTRFSEVMNTPTSRPSALQLAKTPKHVRVENKRKLDKIKYSSEEELSTDESEDESDESPENFSDEENQTPPKKLIPVTDRLLKTPAASRNLRSRGDYNYVLRSDDYFSSAATKAKTSNHTLDRLKNPRLPHDQLMKLLSTMTLSKEHGQAVKRLNKEHNIQFDKWLTLFDQGFTILLHGFGSKINLLQSFHKEKLAKRHVIVINGFFPSLTIKDILDSIWVDILEQQSVGGNPHEIVNKIEQNMKDIPALHLFLIVHNLDGTMLRNSKAQSVLSRLASIKNIHLIASIDHINTPLLWNNTKLSNYNFAWFDVTSFLPYTEETAFEDSLLVQNSGELELSSMKRVFQSLTSNARGIYKLIMNYQLENSNNLNYQGMSFKDLYSSCRETFLVSSDVALRAQLTEFLDHKLLKMKRATDGTENVIIPIKNHLLEQFILEN